MGEQEDPSDRESDAKQHVSSNLTNGTKQK